jgi:hypothetical protein
LSTRDRHARQQLIFLAVLILHIAVVLYVVRASRLAISLRAKPYESLLLLLFPDNKPASSLISAPPVVGPPAHADKPVAAPAKSSSAITIPPELTMAPKIDWEHEAEVAAASSVIAAEKDTNYRNLGGLSSAQLAWIKQNHMVLTQPGIAWHRPRFEFDKNSGLPIFWINEHCVLVTVFVFCGIGHIEANGELFKHMRDPKDP